MANKQMPHSIEAEQALIGAIINDPNEIVKMSEKIHPQFFYDQTNKLIYQALVDLHHHHINIDLFTLKEQLEKNESLLLIGGMEYVVELTEMVSFAINIEEYSNIVYEKYLIRETINRSSKILQSGYDAKDSAELIELAEKEIFELGKMTRSEEFINWQDLIKNSHEEFKNRVAQGGVKMRGLATGFKNLDRMTNGLQKSDLIIIAARPSVGKTAFVLNLARNVAANTNNNNASVAIFSLEMGADQLLTRMLAMQSAVPIGNLFTGKVTTEEEEQVYYGYEKLNEYNIHIDETPGIKIGELKSKCRKLKIEQGLDLIAIDYLQLITTATGGDNRQQEVSEISRELKALAKELQVPVIALSQLSRGVEQRADKKPMMSDIRESGAIEQDADIIMMLYRPEYYGDNIEVGEEEIYDGKTQLLITKHRNGATGELEFKFQKEINKFIAIDQYVE